MSIFDERFFLHFAAKYYIIIQQWKVALEVIKNKFNTKLDTNGKNFRKRDYKNKKR